MVPKTNKEITDEEKTSVATKPNVTKGPPYSLGNTSVECRNTVAADMWQSWHYRNVYKPALNTLYFSDGKKLTTVVCMVGKQRVNEHQTVTQSSIYALIAQLLSKVSNPYLLFRSSLKYILTEQLFNFNSQYLKYDLLKLETLGCLISGTLY